MYACMRSLPQSVPHLVSHGKVPALLAFFCVTMATPYAKDHLGKGSYPGLFEIQAWANRARSLAFVRKPLFCSEAHGQVVCLGAALSATKCCFWLR